MVWMVGLVVMRDFKMNNHIISYSEISYTQSIDKNQTIRVLLSNYQAFLFRSKIEMQKQIYKKHFIKDLLDKVMFSLTMLAIFVSCPRVAFLSYFHDADSVGLEKIEFQKYGDKVLVIFSHGEKNQ